MDRIDTGWQKNLSSPWNIADCSSGGGFIFIAIAGLYQIWAYHIQLGKIGPLAGSGFENIVES
jgi:hypothetical protein